MLDPTRSLPWLEEITRLVGKVARPGFWNSLSRLLVHLTAPGVPDIYQGDEMWNFALVDPDNRRPVDYPRRQKALEEFGDGSAPEATIARMLDQPEDGGVKLYVTMRASRERRARPDLFAKGRYQPLAPFGSRAAHVFAFSRAGADDSAVTIVSRFPLTLSGAGGAPAGPAIWGDTQVAVSSSVRRWRCALGGHAVPAQSGDNAMLIRVGDALAHLPVALLLAE